MQLGLSEQHFSSSKEVKNWIDEWLASKNERWYCERIHQLPKIWKKVIDRVDVLFVATLSISVIYIYFTPCVKISYDTRAKNVFLTSVITSLAFGSCCKLTLVRKRFIALVA